MNPILIGVCGPAGSGKSEVAKILADYGRICIIPFAGPLKAMAKQFGWDGRKDEKGRKYLQLLGTEIGRAYNSNYWVDQWVEQSKKAVEDKFEIIIADDCRFDNEAKTIKQYNGTILKLWGRKDELGNNATHASEVGINDCYIDYSIDNSGSLVDLADKVLSLITWIKTTTL